MSRFDRFMKPVKALKATFTGAYTIFVQTLTQKAEWLESLESRLDVINKKVAKSDVTQLYLAIGTALTAWARMEEAIVSIVAVLLRTKTNRAGLIMYSIVNFNVWLSLTHDLIEMDDLLRPHQRRWNKISERIREIKDKRDQLAHHPVDESDVETGGFAKLQASIFDARNKSRKQPPMTSDEIMDLAQKITIIAKDILALSDAMAEDVLAALRDKSSSEESGHYRGSGAQ